MWPVLFKVGGLEIHTYGVLIALGFLLCVLVAKNEAERQGLSGEKIIDLGFWSLLIGMLGSRILFVITRWSYFSQNPIESFYVWEGGLVFYGGPLLNIPFFIWYAKKYKMPKWKLLDISVTSIPLAHAFGRLGCLSAGCCYGRPTGGNWGVKLYSDLVDPYMRGIYLHPTQIYEAVSLLILFFLLRQMHPGRRFQKKFDGAIFITYGIAYSIIRSIIEIFRGDGIRGFVIQDVLSTSQFIAILVIIAASILYFRMKKKAQSL